MESNFEQRILELNATPVHAQPTSLSEKKVYTIPEIQDILGISVSTAYKLASQNLFRCVKISRHIRISKHSFDAWLDGQIEGVS